MLCALRVHLPRLAAAHSKLRQQQNDQRQKKEQQLRKLLHQHQHQQQQQEQEQQQQREGEAWKGQPEGAGSVQQQEEACPGSAAAAAAELRHRQHQWEQQQEELLRHVRPLVVGALGALPGRRSSLRDVQAAIQASPHLSCWLTDSLRRKEGGISRQVWQPWQLALASEWQCELRLQSLPTPSNTRRLPLFDCLAPRRWRTAAKLLLRSPAVALPVGTVQEQEGEEGGGQQQQPGRPTTVYQLAPGLAASASMRPGQLPVLMP